MTETTPTHPWAAAWTALSPQRRTALWARYVDREPVAQLAERLGRTVEDTEALVSSTVLAFRREVVLGIGTGYEPECGSLVLRLVDSAEDRLTRSERRALADHADTCPACARAVGEMLELDARLRDGLLQLGGPRVEDTPVVAGPAVPAPRDEWAPAFERLTPERRAALVHGAAGAEPPSALAARLGTSESAARDLAASSVVAFRQTVLRRLPVGTGEGCALVAAHRVEDVGLDAARTRALRAHAASCADCAPAVDEIIALHESLRPRVAALALGAEATPWLKSRPRRSWVPGVEAPAEASDRRRLGLGAGLGATVVAAVALVGALATDQAPVDVAAAPQVVEPALPVTADDVVADRVVLAGARLRTSATDRTGTPASGAVGTAATPLPASAPAAPAPQGPAPQPAAPAPVDEQPGEQPGNDPGTDPGEPGTQAPPLAVSVDERGSVTVTVGLLGDPVVISTPPLGG